MKLRELFLVLILSVALCACNAAQNPVLDQGLSGPEPEPIATAPEPNPTPEPAVEEDPTPTPEASPTAEPLALVFLEDGAGMSSPGPWMVFHTAIGIVAVAADGSEVASLGFPLDDQVTSWAAASQGGVVALVKDFFASAPDDGHKWLEVRSLPTNEVIFEMELMDYAGAPISFDSEQDRTDFIADLNRAVGQLAWSNDGMTLAFVGAQNGPSPDVYTYLLDSGEVIQLTSGPSHAVELTWSPDDRYIFHAGVDKMFAGYSGAGYAGWTFYAVSPDGSEVLTVADGTDEIQQEFVIGWYSDREVLMASGQWYCGLFDFRMVNIESGTQSMIMEGQHSYSAYDPGSQNALVWISSDSFDSEECGPAGEPGLYMVSVPGGEVERLEGYSEDITILGIEWDQTGGVFLADGGNTWLVVDPDGAISESPYPPAYSPDGKWIATVEGEGDQIKLYNVETGEVVWRKAKGLILHPAWSPDSSRLFYFQERGEQNRFDLLMMGFPGLTATLVVEDIFSRYDPKPIWLMP